MPQSASSTLPWTFNAGFLLVHSSPLDQSLDTPSGLSPRGRRVTHARATVYTGRSYLHGRIPSSVRPDLERVPAHCAGVGGEYTAALGCRPEASLGCEEAPGGTRRVRQDMRPREATGAQALPGSARSLTLEPPPPRSCPRSPP